MSSGKKLTIAEFIERAKKIHGNKYDYSLVDYKNIHTKVKIICKEHGVFEKIPSDHINKYGCHRCTRDSKLLTEQFIERANKIHNSEYDYSLVSYEYSDIKVPIICKKHGIFEQRPSGHMKGDKCPGCMGNKKLTLKEFLVRAKEVHGSRYIYDKVQI